MGWSSKHIGRIVHPHHKKKKRAKKRLVQIEQDICDFVRQLKEFDAGNGYISETCIYNELLDCGGFHPLLMADRGVPVNKGRIEQGIGTAVAQALKNCSDLLREEINTLEAYVYHRDVESVAEEKKLLKQIQEMNGEVA